MAALEAALLLKEIAGVPAEGLETREAATSGMYALAPGHLVVALPVSEDPHAAETTATCADRGARVVTIAAGERLTHTSAPLTTFPGALALAVRLGMTAGLDVDRPAWLDAYYSTARTSRTEHT